MTPETLFKALRTRLMGMPCVRTFRAADMRIFQFGELRQCIDKKGRPFQTGEVTWHIQSPWRIALHGELITGRTDLWEPPPGEERTDAWTYDHGNLQDVLLRRVFVIQDPPTRSLLAPGDAYVVAGITLGPFGSLRIQCLGGLEIETFTDASPLEEQWRLFATDGGEHAVMLGNGGLQPYVSDKN